MTARHVVNRCNGAVVAAKAFSFPYRVKAAIWCLTNEYRPFACGMAPKQGDVCHLSAFLNEGVVGIDLNAACASKRTAISKQNSEEVTHG